jgi:hypothetical protein
MGGYISTYLSSTTVAEMKDASGNTVLVTTATPNNDVMPLPPSREEQQTTVETKVDDSQPKSQPETPPPPSPVPPAEKTVTVEPLPDLTNQKHQVNVGGKNKKKGKKH